MGRTRAPRWKPAPRADCGQIGVEQLLVIIILVILIFVLIGAVR